MQNEDIGLIIVDSLSTFYWQHRWESERRSHLSLALQHFVTSFQSLQGLYSCVFAVSNWALFEAKTGYADAPTIPTQLYHQHFVTGEYKSIEKKWLRFTHLIEIEESNPSHITSLDEQLNNTDPLNRTVSLFIRTLRSQLPPQHAKFRVQ
jgi:hypothetical protein